MPYRFCLSLVLILAAASIEFTQTLGDLARAERARRQLLTRGAASADKAATLVGREALIKEALRVSGARRQVEQVLQSSLPALTSGKLPDGMPPRQYQKVVSDVFDVERLMRLVEKSISDSVADKTLIDIVRWYRSPLGNKIAMAEISGNQPQASARLQQYAAALQSNAPSESRQQLVDAITATALGLPRPASDFDKNFPAQSTDAISQGTSLWFLFTYSSLSETELSSYLTFLKSPSVTAFSSAVWSGMDATFSDAAQRFSRRLAEKPAPALLGKSGARR